MLIFLSILEINFSVEAETFWFAKSHGDQSRAHCFFALAPSVAHCFLVFSALFNHLAMSSGQIQGIFTSTVSVSNFIRGKLDRNSYAHLIQETVSHADFAVSLHTRPLL
jgi:hypothetical protein